MPTRQSPIIRQLLDLLTNRLSMTDLTDCDPETCERLAVQLEYWGSMAVSVSSDTARNA